MVVSLSLGITSYTTGIYNHVHDLNDLSLLLQIILGVVTGTLTGLTGASGMSVLISVLLGLRTPPEQIISTTFAVAGVNASFAMMPYLRKHKPTLHELSVFAVPASLGGIASYLFIATELSSGFLGLCLTGFMLIAGIYLTMNKKGEKKQLLHIPRVFIGILSFVSGGIIGIFGGGGTIFITLGLVILFGIQYHRALMLSLLMTVFTCIPLIALSYTKDNLAIEPILVILASSIPCALIAGTWANKLPETMIKRVLGIYLIGISLYLFVSRI